MQLLLRGENLKVDKRANFCIFFVIAVLALGLSNFAAAYTGDLIVGSFPGINDTDKMIALDDDNFAPASINAVYEKKVVEEVNETDNETDTNSAIEEDTGEQDSEISTNNANSNTNNNAHSNTNTNENSGNDNSESSSGGSHTESDSDDE